VFGDVAQMGERLPCTEEVRGSNPLISTGVGGRGAYGAGIGWGDRLEVRRSVSLGRLAARR
jgi:hypothetical protein